MDYIYGYDSPVGKMTMASDGTALTALWFHDQKYFAQLLSKPCTQKLLPVFQDTIRWLDIYFSGAVPDFTPELSVHSTPFRESVWNYLLIIPYGKTTAYGEIAKSLSEKMSAQAVGAAVGRNPIPIIIPCHRVVGADGSLTGYAGGIDRKRFLLELERNTVNKENASVC